MDPSTVEMKEEKEDDVEVKEEEVDVGVEEEEIWVDFETGQAVPGPSGQSAVRQLQRVLLIEAKSPPARPPEGELLFHAPSVPEDFKSLKKLKKLKKQLEGTMAKSIRDNALHVEHCEAFYYVSPQENDLLCFSCFEGTREG